MLYVQNLFISLLLVILAVPCIFLSSCKEKAIVKEDTEVFSTDIPSDFLDFYTKFHSDSLYQIEHIVFPLERTQDGGKWDKENWVIHKNFDDHNGNFTRTFMNLKGLIIEKISDKSGMYTIERRFMKSSLGYDLIYYLKVNAFENSEDWSPEG